MLGAVGIYIDLVFAQRASFTELVVIQAEAAPVSEAHSRGVTGVKNTAYLAARIAGYAAHTGPGFNCLGQICSTAPGALLVPGAVLSLRGV